MELRDPPSNLAVGNRVPLLLWAKRPVGAGMRELFRVKVKLPFRVLKEWLEVG